MEKMSTLHSSDYHFQLSFLSTPVWSLRFEYAMNPESCEREIRIFFYSVTQQDRAQFFTVNIAVKMATSFQGRFSHCRARGNFPRFTTHALLPIFLEESWVLEWIRVNPDTCWIWYVWTSKFDFNADMCWRGNFWIRKEKVADSKISGYVWSGSHSNKQRILHAEKYFCTLKEQFCSSKRPCNVLFILKNTSEISSHFTLFPFFFKERSDLSHVAIAKVMFSRVRSKAHLVYCIRGI